jgi:PPOX class probable F420-dependent enzyme
MPRTTFTDEERHIFEQQVLVHVATLNPDGSPHVSAMWVELDGDTVVLNTEEGRVKPRNIRNDPRVSLSVVDPDDVSHNISIQGLVSEITFEGADEGINRLSRKYRGEDYPFFVADKRRIKFTVQPTAISGSIRRR